MDQRISTAIERRRPYRFNFSGRLRTRRTGEREALVLALLCALDMYTTLFWVVFGYATEANPALAWTFDYHPMTFVLVKWGSCLPALALAPRLAQRRPTLTVWLLRAEILVYLALYTTQVRL